MQVSSIMTPNPAAVFRDTSLDEALALMDKHGIRHLPVLHEGTLVGILSDRDLLEATGWLPSRVHACRGPGFAEQGSRKVSEIMVGEPVEIRPVDSIATASVEILERRIGCLPVVENGVLVGVLTEMDLLNAYVEGQLGEGPSAHASTPVSEHMTPAPLTIDWETTLGSAIEILSANGFRHLPVVEGGQLVGLVSDRDLRRAQGAGRHEEQLIEELVTTELVTVPADAGLARAAEVMLQRKISSLPVVQDGEFVGLLTLSDLLDHCLDEFRARGESAARS